MLVALLIVLSPAVQATPATAARVAVLMSARVEEYDEAVRGFRGAIPKEAVTVYDMDGDIERGRKQLDEIDSKLKPDLVLAVGIWALRAVRSAGARGAKAGSARSSAVMGSGAAGTTARAGCSAGWGSGSSPITCWCSAAPGHEPRGTAAARQSAQWMEEMQKRALGALGL